MGEEIVPDLFGGARALPSGRRGRPSHRWSQENENRVILGLALDYSDAEIAFGLGISLPTLRKHYFSALQRRGMEATRFELWRVQVLGNLANDGNVGAIKELGKIADSRRRLKAAERAAAATGSGPEKAVPKKVARQAAADGVAGGDDHDWGDLLKPGGTRVQ